MLNTVYIETHTTYEKYQKSHAVELPLESLVIFCIYKYCSPEDVNLKFVYTSTSLDKETRIILTNESFSYIDPLTTPWQLMCAYPVVMHDDTVLAGLCAVARHISKFISVAPLKQEHAEGLLGFRRSCLQAPNEASIWTKFCEVDLVKTVKDILNSDELKELPINLLRFENHLKKPVRVHNVYKIARDLKKDLKISNDDTDTSTESVKVISGHNRIPKIRKWKSNKQKELEINSSTKIIDLDINHQFAEGPFVTLADLVLLPLYHIIVQSLGKTFENLLPFTYKWYEHLTDINQLLNVVNILKNIRISKIATDNITIPITEDVSLYKCDPKRHNPKKRLFTKEDDIENALNCLTKGMELKVSKNDFEPTISWKDIPDGANPMSGHLPDERVTRKSQQLENLALAVLNIAKDGDLIVDFCSGSGHLGILVAYLLPKCTVILLENKEQSLLRARNRVHDMGLKNVFFFQCNLDFFNGKFDIGLALHACGIASDLVLDKCLKSNAKFVLCPCCYGSLHATDRLVYPRSKKFSSFNIDQYLCIGHAADQTHDDHPLTARGSRCMAVIDSDRGCLAGEFGYDVTLTRLKPLSCTPKNNLLIGIPK